MVGTMTEAETFEHTQRVEQRRLTVSNILYQVNDLLRDVEALDKLEHGVAWTLGHNQTLSLIAMRVMMLTQKTGL